MFRILVLTIVVGSLYCCFGQAEIGSSSDSSSPSEYDHAEVFDLINGHLKRTVKSLDEETYMWESVNWLESQLKLISSYDKSRLSEVLNLLKAFSRLKYDVHCNRKSFEVLLNVSKATRGRAHYRYYVMGSARPIDKMVRYFFERHATACASLYPKIFKNMLVNKDEKMVSTVESIVNGLVSSKITRKTLTPYENERYELRWRKTEGAQVKEDLMKFTNEEIEGFTTFLSIESLSNPLELLEYLSSDDTNKNFLRPILDNNMRKMVVEENQVELLYLRNLVTPCLAYLTEMADLFLVAEFDDQVVDIHSQDKYTMIEFFMGRAGYSFCSRLVNESKLRILKRLIKSVIL